MKQHQCRVISQAGMCRDIWRLRVHAPDLVNSAVPGQFVHIRVRNDIEPLLRRPFGVHRIDREKGELEVLYRVVGHGTKLMTKYRPGDIIDILGPLGNGFSVTDDIDHALVVAGGMGIAPVFYLIDELLARGKKVSLFWGARLCEEIFVKPGQLEKDGLEVHLAVEEGGMGHQGFVTELLPDYLAELSAGQRIQGFACGPNPMLSALKTIAVNHEVPWQFSLEAHMACGVGVCMGCGVKKPSEDGYHMVCSHGPVFDMMEVTLDD